MMVPLCIFQNCTKVVPFLGMLRSDEGVEPVIQRRSGGGVVAGAAQFLAAKF